MNFKDQKIAVAVVTLILFISPAYGRFSTDDIEDTDNSSLSQAELAEVSALSHYGWGHYQMGASISEREEANKQFLMAIQHDPYSDFLIKETVRFWLRHDTHEEDDQLIEYLSGIAIDNPGAIHLNLAVAEAYIEREQFELARDLLTAVLRETKWTEPFVIKKLSQCYLGTGEIGKGARLLRHATLSNKFRGDFNVELAAAIFYDAAAHNADYRISKNKRYEYQTLTYEHALRSADAFPGHNTVKIDAETMQLIAILLRGNFVGRVISILSTLRDNGKRSIDADRLLAECLESSEQFEKAFEIWKELSGRFPLNPFYHTRMGRVLKLSQRYKDALLAFETAYRLVESTEIAFEIATLYLLMKQPNRALEYAQRSSVHRLDTHLLLSYIYRDLNQFEESLRVLVRAQDVTVNGDTPNFLTMEYYLTLATTYFTLSREEETISTLEKALVLFPENADANNFLGYYLADKNRDLQRAKKCILSALKTAPDSPAYLDSLAWVYYRQGLYRKAVKNVARALRLQKPKYDSVILDHAGDIYSAIGDFEKAVQYWQQALEQGAEKKDQLEQKIRDAKSRILP